MSNENLPTSVDANRVDYIVTGLKGVFDLLPVVGPLAAEATGMLIPNQHFDRIGPAGAFSAKVERHLKRMGLEWANRQAQVVGSQYSYIANR